MKAVIWSKDNCPNCVQAKNLLKLKGVAYEERMLGDKWTREDLLALVPTARTMPQVFLDDKLIGGFSELKQLLVG